LVGALLVGSQSSVAVYCGIDRAEGHHDIALVDHEGTLVAKRRIKESLDGITELTAMLAAAGDRAEDPIPVAIETPRGLLVAVLRATGRPVYPINPLAVARYRERTSVSGKKSDHVDAMALANILRTDAHLHRMLPDDSALARSITVLARAYQDAVWRRTKLVQELRARLRECYPGFLAAFAAGSGSGRGLSTTQLASSDARAVLTIAPSPAEGLTVSKARVETALRRGGRQRRIGSLAASIVAALRLPQLRQDSLVEQAMRTETLALLGVLDAICDSVDQLAAALVEAFSQHPDYKIITSFPGLADISGAIVLAEIGDDRTRFGDDRALQAFAGSAPVTRTSGKSRTVTRRRTKNNRLAAIGYSWAFSARCCHSPTCPHPVGGHGCVAAPIESADPCPHQRVDALQIRPQPAGIGIRERFQHGTVHQPCPADEPGGDEHLLVFAGHVGVSPILWASRAVPQISNDQRCTAAASNDGPCGGDPPVRTQARHTMGGHRLRGTAFGPGQLGGRIGMQHDRPPVVAGDV
jgi:transposase